MNQEIPIPVTPSTDKDLEDKKIEELTAKTWFRIKWVLWIGVLVVFITSLNNPGSGLTAFPNLLARIGCGILLGGASLAAGGFLGFIFGIPSLLQNQNVNQEKATTFKYNDNLVQISDWLTKIIVGVGLTQLNKIPAKVGQLGDHLKESFGGEVWGRNASLFITFYFLLFGFLIIYFWTRTDFTTIMKKTDDDINEVKKENAQIKEEIKDVKEENELVKTEIKQVKAENEQVKDTIITSKSKEEIDKNEHASDVTSLPVLENTMPDPLKQALADLTIKVKEELAKRPVTDTEDLQKNRWGGVPIKSNKKISAEVVPNSWQDFYDVKITVADTNTGRLETPVAIFIHDTYKYPDNVIYVNPDASGVASLTLIAYEAFTIGALLPDGTDLELDLNTQPGSPKGFYYPVDKK
ncbi:hypothetical protein HB364_32270 [Pseudoflavitalea sp. X16]|uniref:pYEATS domain-containing protein n=1 Tax=Paraflavitalea devenefica TaxID=2716334 RepID=UPI001420989A|nr:pYEATS domain-containing protein [Paraflavitalea devenefica]NII29798.1 hypothetical protein [Paraflavitalea devenefica]